jgi:hypothetical protein
MFFQQIFVFGCFKASFPGILGCGKVIFTENNVALAPSVTSNTTTNLERRTTINMFEFAGGRKATESKCYVTHGTMGHLDPKQPPVKRKPYAAILAIPFVHKVRIPRRGERRMLRDFFPGRAHSTTRTL